ncbi:hypothetical protein M514_25743, partial [Trichuris suis]
LSCFQLAKRPGFEEVEYQDAGDVLNCQPDELTIEELQELSVAGETEGREEAEDDENQEAPPQQLTTAVLLDALGQPFSSVWREASLEALSRRRRAPFSYWSSTAATDGHEEP